jgi:hypothetical protein
MELGGPLRNKSLKIRWPDTPDCSSSEQASLDNARVTPVTGHSWVWKTGLNLYPQETSDQKKCQEVNFHRENRCVDYLCAERGSLRSITAR